MYIKSHHRSKAQLRKNVEITPFVLYSFELFLNLSSENGNQYTFTSYPKCLQQMIRLPSVSFLHN